MMLSGPAGGRGRRAARSAEHRVRMLCKAAPADSRANDLWHWQTTLATPDAAKAGQKLRAAQGRVVSPQVAQLPEKSLGFGKGFLARDPDGHGLQLIEK